MVQFYFVKMGYFLSRERAVTLLGKIFLGFLVPLNHFQVPISSLLLLVPRNLLETFTIRMGFWVSGFLVCASSIIRMRSHHSLGVFQGPLLNGRFVAVGSRLKVYTTYLWVWFDFSVWLRSEAAR